jgi:predicted nucleic acid-binding Zn finger protein
MQSLTHRGIRFRTRCLPHAQAERFAACLAANERFRDVEVVESARAKGERRHFVEFLPANPERLAAMLSRQQDARQQRADTEGRDYVFALDKNAGRVFAHCFNPSSGQVYETTEHTCSCPDWEWRCSSLGLSCKHQLALAAALARGEVGRFEPEPPIGGGAAVHLGDDFPFDLRADVAALLVERRAA